MFKLLFALSPIFLFFGIASAVFDDAIHTLSKENVTYGAIDDGDVPSLANTVIVPVFTVKESHTLANSTKYTVDYAKYNKELKDKIKAMVDEKYADFQKCIGVDKNNKLTNAEGVKLMNSCKSVTVA